MIHRSYLRPNTCSGDPTFNACHHSIASNYTCQARKLSYRSYDTDSNSLLKLSVRPIMTSWEMVSLVISETFPSITIELNGEMSLARPVAFVRGRL